MITVSLYEQKRKRGGGVVDFSTFKKRKPMPLRAQVSCCKQQGGFFSDLWVVRGWKVTVPPTSSRTYKPRSGYPPKQASKTL